MSTRDAWQQVTVNDFVSTGVDMQIGIIEVGDPADSGDFIYADDAVLDAGPVAFDEVLGSFDGGGDYEWGEFDDIKAARMLTAGRERVFHYSVAAYRHGSATNGSSGRSRINGSDFLVSLGAFLSGTGSLEDQIGTFMHELGHNLGLRHGGDTNLNHKPNYLSVMNYSFQFSGVARHIGGGEYDFGFFDYSRLLLASLDESSLDEPDGLGSAANEYGTAYYCSTSESSRKEVKRNASEPIDWNCDDDTTDVDLVRSVNKDEAGETLSGFNDWEAVVFVGGGIGGEGWGPLWFNKLQRLAATGEHGDLSFEEARRGGLLSRKSYPKEIFERGESNEGR